MSEILINLSTKSLQIPTNRVNHNVPPTVLITAPQTLYCTCFTHLSFKCEVSKDFYPFLYPYLNFSNARTK